MSEMNQTEAILNHLKEYGELTSMEAFRLYGCTRLSARIYDLKARGYIIDSVDTMGFTRYGTPCRYSTYVLAKEQRNGSTK